MGFWFVILFVEGLYFVDFLINEKVFDLKEWLNFLVIIGVGLIGCELG